jgi:hypothetical protein
MGLVIVLQLVLLSGCTAPVPATVTRAPATALESNPKVFVQATVQQGRIVESLRNAGIDAQDSLPGADYTLVVKVGRNRRSTQCGGISNVAYLLSGEGRYVLVIKGRGLTGSCRPNIFDEMSEMLASYAGS